jgi:hypothetical protein
MRKVKLKKNGFRVMDKDYMTTETFEHIAVEIASLDKPDIIEKIMTFHGRFKLDFTEDFLAKLNVDRLRHILLAAIMTNSTWQND